MTFLKGVPSCDDEDVGRGGNHMWNFQFSVRVCYRTFQREVSIRLSLEPLEV